MVLHKSVQKINTDQIKPQRSKQKLKNTDLAGKSITIKAHIVRHSKARHRSCFWTCYLNNESIDTLELVLLLI